MSKPKLIIPKKLKSHLGDPTVISLQWVNAYCHRFILSDGAIVEQMKVEGVGIRAAKPTVYGGPWCYLLNGKAYINKVPEGTIRAWIAKHTEWMQEEAKKIIASAPVPNPRIVVQEDYIPKKNQSSKVSPFSSQEIQAMQLKQKDVVALFEVMDYSTASKWSPKRLLEKTKTLPSLVDEDTNIEDDKLAKLLKKILKALEAEEEIEILGDEDAEDAGEDEPKPKKGKKAEKPADKKGKKAKKEEEDESDDEDEDESDDEDEDEKPAKKAKGKKAEKPAAKSDKKVDKKGNKKEEEAVPVHKKKPKPPKPGKRGVGVIATIIEELRKGTEKKPKKKEDILAVLVKKFPDREEKAMKSTISSQIPSGLKTEKGLTVESNDKGFWLPAEK